VVTAAIIIGYNLGVYFTNKGNKTGVIQNYSFVRDIAELASLEVTGTTSSTTSNIRNDGSFTDDLKKLLIENTVRLTAPFTAKYGVDLSNNNFRIEQNDSVVKVYLPPPTLLSYEIHLDRIESTNKKGWFRFQNEEAYNEFHKKMYSESRVLLEKNQVYLTRSRNKICDIIQKYFVPLQVKTICIYDVQPAPLQNKPN
jgi:hypothetical protein